MKLSDPQAIGKIIVFHRKQAKLSREQLARLSGVGKTAIYDVEHGKLTVRLVTLLKILHVLNIQMHLNSPLMVEWFSSEKVQYEKS